MTDEEIRQNIRWRNELRQIGRLLDRMEDDPKVPPPPYVLTMSADVSEWKLADVLARYHDRIQSFRIKGGIPK